MGNKSFTNDMNILKEPITYIQAKSQASELVSQQPWGITAVLQTMPDTVQIKRSVTGTHTQHMFMYKNNQPPYKCKQISHASPHHRLNIIKQHNLFHMFGQQLYNTKIYCRRKLFFQLKA